jgi:hypothetical protein
MDPISLIEAALVAGAAASTKDTASQAVKDAYSGLKMGLSRLLASKPQAQVILNKHATDPKTYEEPLKTVLAEAHVDQDNKLLAVAQQIMVLVQHQQM